MHTSEMRAPVPGPQAADGAAARLRALDPTLPDASARALAEAVGLRLQRRFPAARERLDAVEAAHPGSPAVARERIVLAMASDAFDEAEALLTTESRRTPDDPWVWRTLARVCAGQRRDAAEAEAIGRLLALQPEEGPARRLFELRRDAGDLAGALDVVQRLRRMRDTDDLLVAQVRLLERLARDDEALRLCEERIEAPDVPAGVVETWARLLGHRPGGPETVLERCRQRRLSLGESVPFLMAESRMLNRMDRTDAAIPLMQRALAIDGGEARGWYDLGVQLRQMGRMEEAQQALARSLRIDPMAPTALRVHAAEHRHVYGDAAWLRLQSALAELERFPKDQQVELHYAVAKALEDVGDLDAAFRHYAVGGRKQGEIAPYRHGVSVGLMRTLRQGMRPLTYASFPHPGHPGDDPVFVLGMPRSGTTLVEQILASHPHAHGAGELKVLGQVLHGVSINGVTLRPAEDRGGRATYVPGVDLDCTTLGFAERGERYVAAVRALAAAAGRGDARRIVDKMPGNHVWTGLIPLILPNARIVHTRRHPMDCCLSNYRIFFPDGMPWSYDLRDLGRAYRAYHEHMLHWEENLPAGTMISVRYEDLVADLDTQARRIVAHAGLDWDDACLRFHETERPVRTASLSQVRQPLYTRAVGRWRRYERFLQPLLHELGPLVDAYESELEAAAAHTAPADRTPA